jgi:hypothetical protein
LGDVELGQARAFLDESQNVRQALVRLHHNRARARCLLCEYLQAPVLRGLQGNKKKKKSSGDTENRSQPETRGELISPTRLSFFRLLSFCIVVIVHNN